MVQRTCSIEGCGRSVRARGWCNAHYIRYRRHGDPLAGGAQLSPDPRRGKFAPSEFCTIKGCDAASRAWGLCNMHYLRAKRRGEPELRMLAGSLEESFVKYTRTEGDCLIWTGSTIHNGYGRVKFEQRSLPAHRAAWELANGPIPGELVVRHKCDNPPCVKLDHLELGTQQDNVNDMIARGRAHWQKTPEETP